MWRIRTDCNEKEIKDHVWSSGLNCRCPRRSTRLQLWCKPAKIRAQQSLKGIKRTRQPAALIEIFKEKSNQLVFFDESSSEDVASLLLLSLLLSLLFSRSGTTAVDGSTLDSRAAPITCSGSSSYVFAWKYTSNSMVTAKSEDVDRKNLLGCW